MKNKEFVLYTVILVLWFIIVLLTGLNHEPWADEAQSWLISRDTGYIDMIRSILRYEGHPFLWYFILRTFSLMCMPYEFIFFVPFLFMAIGVYLIMFKTRLPIIVKTLFPFTFFIIYQYSIVARSYSLYLPILTGIAILYDQRTKRPFIYAFLLILLLSSSAYSYCIAAVLLVFWVYDILKQESYNIKTLTGVFFTIFFMFVTYLYLKIPADCISYEPFVIPSVKKICYILQNGYFDIVGEKFNSKFSIPIILFYVVAAINFCKNKKQVLFFSLVNAAIILIMSITVCRQWHYGHIIITLIFTLSVLCAENKEKYYSKYINIVFCIMFALLSFIQVCWGYKAIKYDLLNKYSAGRDIADFIKVNNFDKYEINGLGYDSVSVQPYFKRNIYKNYKTAHFMFSRDFKSYNYEQARKLSPIMVYDSSWYKGYSDIIDNLKDYYIFLFKGQVSYKGRITDKPSIYVFVKKDLK